MKISIQKYTGILSLVLCIFFMQACDKNFKDINTNPDAVSNPTPEYVFSKALYDGTANCANTETLLYGTMQYTTSYNDVEGFGSKYVAARTDLTMGVFGSSFPAQINEIGIVIKAVKDDPSKINEYAEARIWRAFCFSRLTDLYGDIPYSQAGQGYNQSIFQPAYDAQKDIYPDLLNELDQAATSLDPNNTVTFGSSDLIYGGNTLQWKKFAYSLMLRLGMRLTKVDPASAQTWVTKAIAGGVITSYADIAKLNYLGSGQVINENPVALLMLNDNYIKADGISNTEGGKYQQVFIDSLKMNNDPRLPFISVVYVNGVADTSVNIQKGMPSNISGTRPSDFVNYSEPNQNTILRLNCPILLFTAAESDFLLAEAALRNWYTGQPADILYENGIRAAMQQWDLLSGVTGTIAQGRIDSYVAAHALNTGASFDKQLEQIYNQFWVGIFPDAQEVYNNYRRTGYPALVPNNYPGNATGGQIFRRLLYPTSEQTLNRASYDVAVANQGPDDLLTRVWWDKP